MHSAQLDDTSKPSHCPSCGSARVARIQYGLVPPTEELLRGLDEEKVVLGGCHVWDGMPSWRCLECQAEERGGKR